MVTPKTLLLSTSLISSSIDSEVLPKPIAMHLHFDQKSNSPKLITFFASFSDREVKLKKNNS